VGAVGLTVGAVVEDQCKIAQIERSGIFEDDFDEFVGVGTGGLSLYAVVIIIRGRR